ncbi:MAG TPA: DUF58 domain-containing protein [Kofleriaceae bacterium]|jgi:uncharacterized protein (DUF58 family)|nr:DUF58 domain-containing protein [Kofleriaceae bacterium]
MQPRTLGIITLVLPSLVAAAVTLRVHNERILHVAAPLLAVLWVLMAGALGMRAAFAWRDRLHHPASDRASPWDHLDVLSATGATMMWSGAAALVASGVTGWASLSVIGVLGLGTVYVTAIWTALAGDGDGPWRRATITRSILPTLAVEGDPLREEVHLTGVSIPAGMRLFAAGRAMRHGALSRYAIGSEGSHADITLESELGSARRGEHRAPPLAFWLGDVLGLTRTPCIHRGDATFTVLPRPRAVDEIAKLLGEAGDDAISRPAQRLPTEGTFRIRAYMTGDDTRRIHWVRSLAQNQLVVRLPDELPPAEPAVRLVLDNALRGIEQLTCRAPGELLDALVQVWLSIGTSLAQAGTRVTLVTAIEKAGAIVPVERTLTARSSREAQRLGAKVAWQPDQPLAALLAHDIARQIKQIVVSSRPRRLPWPSELLWIVVPEVAWTSTEPLPAIKNLVKLPFPSGVADNRRSRRNRERRRIDQMWQDRALFSQVICWTDLATFSGEYVARPRPTGISLAVVP